MNDSPKPVSHLKVIFWMALSALLLYLFCILESCNVTKGKKTLSVDSTRVNKVDSGSVKKSTSTEKTTGGYERQTLIYYRDTGFSAKPSTINLQSSPFDYSRLAAVINERGNYQQEKEKSKYDSSWKSELDSLKMVVKESMKDKTEKTSPLLVKIAGAIVLFLAAAATIKYVVKK